MNPFASLIDPPRDLPCRQCVMPEPKPRRPILPPIVTRRNGKPLPNPWGLSWLQCEVVRRLATHSLNDIGRELGIATKTAENVVLLARNKMQAHSRNHAARLWAEHCGRSE